MIYHNIIVEVGSEIDQELASDLIKESVFVSDSINEMEVRGDKVYVLALCSNLDEALNVEKKVKKYVDVMISGHRSMPETVLVNNTNEARRRLESKVFEKLIAKKWVTEIGKGHLSFSGPALTLFQYLNHYIFTQYEKSFSPEDRHFPAMLPGSLLSKAGYFDSHPNNVSFVTHLKNDFDIVETFRKTYGQRSDMDHLPIESIETPHICLNPAACIPCYFSLENSILEKGLTLSWLGRVFRHESKNVKGLERLWEYNVRELVFIGDSHFVEDKKEEAVLCVCNLLDKLDLNYRIVSSTDPFFATVASVKKFWQKSKQAKFEIKLQIFDDLKEEVAEVAAGSINLHDSFFGDRFNIKTIDDKAANSACVGLGIERIMLACFAQHSLDFSNWPKELYDRIFSTNEGTR